MKIGMIDKNRIIGGLWGAIIGDALGVPVEFKSRDERKQDPVTGMRGYGTFNQPPGTWSDDSSLMLCTVESLLDGFDTNRMGELFIRWLDEGYWTPHGVAFDIGRSTGESIQRMMDGVAPEVAGGTSENDNGNGSLMRILPVGIYLSEAPASELIDYAHRASALTHRHPRAQMACGFYCLMVASLLKGFDIKRSYKKAIKEALAFYNELPYSRELRHFLNVFSGTISSIPEDEIQSSGYVIHTLEASIWCLFNSRSYKEAVLKAVNLGWDTDTTGIVTGGLAGIHYGIEAIPEEWIHAVVRKEDIEKLFNNFIYFLT
jgi:ADP-ribosyl-[dinitrogen reductase] hydrolase